MSFKSLSITISWWMTPANPNNYYFIVAFLELDLKRGAKLKAQIELNFTSDRSLKLLQTPDWEVITSCCFRCRERWWGQTTEQRRFSPSRRLLLKAEQSNFLLLKKKNPSNCSSTHRIMEVGAQSDHTNAVIISPCTAYCLTLFLKINTNLFNQ